MATQVTDLRVFVGSDDADTPQSPQQHDIVIIPASGYIWCYDGVTWIKDSRTSDAILIAALMRTLGAVEDATEEDPANDATVIALLKGCLSLQVQILAKLNASINVNVL